MHAHIFAGRFLVTRGDVWETLEPCRAWSLADCNSYAAKTVHISAWHNATFTLAARDTCITHAASAAS